MASESDTAAWKVLVCGGRNYADPTRVNDALSYIHAHRTISLLIHGAAHGTDTLAARWAKNEGVPTRAFSAEWSQHGRAAGPIRNQRMIDECRPDFVVAFFGGMGTADMVRRARAASIPVQEFS